jgi:hypothetical protein
MVASTLADSFLRPEALADSLDLWALRREKVLELLDVRASRTGRQLARACRLLAQPAYAMSISSAAWDAEWRQTREEVAALLRRSRPSVRPSSCEADANATTEMDHTPVVSAHEICTRSIDWSEMEHLDGERPTRIAEHDWTQRMKVA